MEGEGIKPGEKGGEEIQTVVCAWCERVITQGNSKKVSHGICATCADEYPIPDALPEEEKK